jgi:hypothetical protein
MQLGRRIPSQAVPCSHELGVLRVLAAAAMGSRGCAGQRLAVLSGGPHRSEPSFRRATVQPGDLLYPVGACDQVLYVPGRMRVQQIVPAGEDPELLRSTLPGTVPGGSWGRPVPPRSSSAARAPASYSTGRSLARSCSG